MTTQKFLGEIESLSKTNSNTRLYPYEDRDKLYARFLKKVYNDDIKSLLNEGWLGDLYKFTNGVDLSNYYIVPFNNYLNNKKMSFNDFYIDWIINQDNINEISGHFCAFMTNDNFIIGYMDNLFDSKGNNFIGIAQGVPVKDILIISSSICVLYDEIIKQLKETGMINLSEDINFWKSIDPELDKFYQKKLIREYKLRYLFDNESRKYKEYSENEEIQ